MNLNKEYYQAKVKAPKFVNEFLSLTTGFSLGLIKASPSSGFSPFFHTLSRKLGYIYKGMVIAFLILNSSCENWLDINEDPNNPSEADEELTLAAGISSVAYVYGGKYQVLGALWSQHWTQSLGASQYTGLDSYDINSSTFNGQFNELYAGALANLEYIKELAYMNRQWNYYLIATVMQCYTYQLLVDLYDQIPFSEALKGDEGIVAPHFENGQDIYDSLIARIDYALGMDLEAESNEEVGSEDLIFDGNINRWIEFANTLKLKIYLRQVYARPQVAEDRIRQLYADAEIKFLGTDASMTQFADASGRRNPLYETEMEIFGGNPNLVLSNTFLSYMNDNGDIERLDALFNYPEQGGAHKGLDQGNYNDPDEPTGTNSTYYSKPAFYPLDPVYLMSSTESCFLQSEAIIRFNVKSYATAKELYQDGIDKAFDRLGFSGGDAYYEPGDPYAFPAEGSPVEEFIKTIIIQKWVSLANIQSLETFFEHNRTHYPRESQVPADNDNYVPGEFTLSVNNVTSGRFPKRLIFPETEYSGNPNTPAKKDVSEKIWWDKKNGE
ncbi:MAG: SusD/RagB family nutrient-binding outer membrane lipoprotein [Bacteroidales bacterium]|nr:SusD/RagB family nutrient-binding outer membrane lipoprotein [Bacteroidales bacterium]